MAKWTDRHRLIFDIKDNFRDALVAFGFQLEGEIKRSLKKRGSGRIYKRGNVIHRASSPGSPPATDTGRLSGSISTNWTGSDMDRGRVDSPADAGDGIGRPVARDADDFRVVVGTNVEYAPFDEFGTVKMGPRPFIRPAFDRMKGKIRSFMTSARIGRTTRK